MKCNIPHIINPQHRAAAFVDYLTNKHHIPKPLAQNRYDYLSSPPHCHPINIKPNWIDVAISNSTVAATKVMAHVPAGINMRSIPPMPPYALVLPPLHQGQCLRPSFDQWFDSVATALAIPTLLGTYGKAQKFINIYLKYIYCFERSGQTLPTITIPYPNQTLTYECALHAPVDRRVLNNLKNYWKDLDSWKCVKTLICNGSSVKAWTNINKIEYWQIQSLLRAIVNAHLQPHPCGNNALGLSCKNLQIQVPIQDLIEMQNRIVGDNVNIENDPLVSALDLEMRGLWEE